MRAGLIPPVSRGQLIADTAGGALFALVTVVLGPTHPAWFMLVGPLLGGALAIRRVSLATMSALALAAALIQVITGEIHFLANIAFAVLFAALGRANGRGWRAFGLVSAAAAALVAGAFASVKESQRGGTWTGLLLAGITFAIITAFVVVGGWLVGYLQWQRERTREAHSRALVGEAERLRLTQAYEYEQERAQVAAEMHDIVAHSWAVVAAQADGARYAIRTDPAAAEQALTVIGETARASMADLRTLLHRLRYREEGTGQGHLEVEQLVERMRASGLDVRVTTTGSPMASARVSLNAARVLGEALTNALKHGDCDKPVTVAWDWTHGLHLRIVNTLPAVPRHDSGLDTGHGLIGMAERARMLGGTLTAGAHGEQWQVELRVPDPEEKR